jgi:hypothetical protein
MPRVTHVKHARKDYPQAGIKKGDSYYWWAFRFQPPHMSLTAPTRQQLTQSSFLQELYGIEDDIGALTAGAHLADELPEIIGRIEDLSSQCQDSLSNMPEQLQESSSAGQMLQERSDNLDSWASDLSGVELEVDEDALREEAEGEFDEWDDADVRKQVTDEMLQQIKDPDDVDETKVEEEVKRRHDAWQMELDDEVESKVSAAWDTILEEVQGCSSGL